ncbi:MAG: NAD+ synthase, partial [Alphaproteobacteria bacterium]|nr:NAD+ synthase [Alphaproteobacteria bacterium]
MTDTLSIALAQINPTVGDVKGNIARIRAARAKAAQLGADLVVFPELCVAGYQPEDLVLKPAFLDACRAAVEALAGETGDGGPAMLVGAPWVEDKLPFNAALLLDAGNVIARRYKQDLPNYGVFDDKRVFVGGP